MTRRGYKRLAFWVGFMPQFGMVALATLGVMFPAIQDQCWRFLPRHPALWVSVTVLCTFAAFVFWRKSRSPKRVPNCCGNCGYALALGIERCPECGEVGTRVPVPEREGLL